MTVDNAAEFLHLLNRLDDRGLALMRRILVMAEYLAKRGWAVPTRIDVAKHYARQK